MQKIDLLGFHFSEGLLLTNKKNSRTEVIPIF